MTQQTIDDIDGTDLPQSLLQDQYGFQIVSRGLMNGQGKSGFSVGWGVFCQRNV